MPLYFSGSTFSYSKSPLELNFLLNEFNFPRELGLTPWSVGLLSATFLREFFLMRPLLSLEARPNFSTSVAKVSIKHRITDAMLASRTSLSFFYYLVILLISSLAFW